MTFEEWWSEDGLLQFPRTQSEAAYAKKIWQAAQKEAAERCAEICAAACATEPFDSNEAVVGAAHCRLAIEREFGLEPGEQP